MKRANEVGVKVLLSGQGGDELFCGYRKYLGFYLQDLLAKKQYMELCRVGGAFLLNGGLRQFNLTEGRRYLQKSVAQNALGPAMLDAYTAVYLGRGSEGIAQRQWLDYRRFSVPYLTHYEDRASMAFSREVRLPFLDYRLVELMLNAPIDSKLAEGWTKYALRKAFSDQLPKQIIWRKDKQGFSMPQEEWLRGDLKPIWLTILNPQAQVFRRGILNYQGLMSKFDAFCAGKSVWYREIFAPLALEVWLEQFDEFIENA
jgi:asparagine synthase (glutamine-hydrolysing)